MLKHRVRSDLASAGEAGTMSATAIRHTATELLSLAKGADGLLVTTAGLGPVAQASQMLGIPIVEADRALAEAAVADGGTVTVLCVAGAALAPARALFERAAVATGATVEVRLAGGAAALEAEGRKADFLRAIADAADLAFDEGASVVALSHTSMADAAALLPGRRLLTAPAAALTAIVRAVQSGPVPAAGP